MLLEFSVANFRSINKKCTLSMLAQAISDEPKDNVAVVSRNKILKTAAIYGANSSGKSNILSAMNTMISIVLSSVKLNDNDPLDYDPFLLSTNRGRPSFFEVIFLIDDLKYRYGFELNSTLITDEWLFRSKINGKKETALFGRTEEGIGVSEVNFPEGVGKEENTNNNRLFLSLCNQLGGAESKKIILWFQKGINIISGIHSDMYSDYSKKMFHEQIEGCEEAKLFFSKLKLGFKDIETREIDYDLDMFGDNIPSDIREKWVKVHKDKKRVELITKHSIYDENGNIIRSDSFNIDNMESEGTKKIIQLSGPIFDTIYSGKALMIDEIDAKMHPLISHYIIELFNNPATNPKNAQLIFTTHDTHLLSSKLLRRDQIWFTEKDSMQQTDLYNMMDIILPDGSKPRNDTNFGKNYLAGRYGAIPYIINE